MLKLIVASLLIGLHTKFRRGQERHEAVLRLVAILLLQPRRYELEQVEAAYDLIRALLEMARPLSHAAGMTVLNHH